MSFSDSFISRKNGTFGVSCSHLQIASTSELFALPFCKRFIHCSSYAIFSFIISKCLCQYLGTLINNYDVCVLLASVKTHLLDLRL